MAFIQSDDVCNPVAPTDMAKNMPTSSALHPLYAAAITKQPSTTEALLFYEKLETENHLF